MVAVVVVIVVFVDCQRRVDVNIIHKFAVDVVVAEISLSSSVAVMTRRVFGVVVEEI